MVDYIVRIPTRDIRGRPAPPTIRGRDSGSMFSLDPVVPTNGGLTAAGDQLLVTSLPPGNYLFEQDEMGLRIYRVVDDAMIQRGVRDGSPNITSMEELQRCNDAFWNDAEARADAEARLEVSKVVTLPTNRTPTLTEIQRRHDAFYANRGG